jgi:hypothetical protein
MKPAMPVFLALMAMVCATSLWAQADPIREDIPTIAKDAKGSIVTIVMANNDEPLARGTGFLISPDGLILTNYHVVEAGNVGVVKLSDGTVLPIDGLLASDKARDIAIIKIHGKTFRPLTLGNSDRIQVGEDVVAIGNPLGLDLTVSNGILSGVRTRKTENDKLLQITAPISRGGSGGPLFDMFGEVIGISAMFLEGGENLNFAVPINEAKPLLLTRPPKLKSLPNEHEEPSSGDPLPSTTGERGIARREQTEGPYYVRARKNEVYFIEYRGHQLTAHCREALGWHRDTSQLGGPMTQNECLYLPDEVGKHISEDKMVRADNELRYRPFGSVETSAPVADVLDITDDVLLGAPAHPRPAQKTSPEIRRTLLWIQNTLNNRDGDTQYPGAKGEIAAHANLITEVDGCDVTFIYETREDNKETSYSREQINLADLDPSSIKSYDSAPEILGLPVTTVRVQTADEKPTIRLSAGGRGWEPAIIIPTADTEWELPSPYAERFIKALKHAVTLCGGKTSAF